MRRKPGRGRGLCVGFSGDSQAQMRTFAIFVWKPVPGLGESSRTMTVWVCLLSLTVGRYRDLRWISYPSFIHLCRVNLDIEPGTIVSMLLLRTSSASAGGDTVVNGEILGSLCGFDGPNLESCRLVSSRQPHGAYAGCLSSSRL